MGLRPAKTVRIAQGQVWTRISQKTPRKSFVKGAPRPKVRQYHMGADKYYEVQADLVAASAIQLRDNSLESGRQAANRFLEKKLIANYYLTLLKYPHLVIREKGAMGVAGADRISKGMKLAFGKPKGRMIRVLAGESIFRGRVMAKDLSVLKDALTRARLKMSGNYTFKITDITSNPLNLAKKGREAKVFKKVEIEKPKEEAAAAPAEGAKAEEGKAEAGKEGAGKEASGKAEAKGAEAKGGKGKK